MYQTTLTSERGGLFGLTPTDLTLEQLNKIKFNKLIEFIEADPRVEDIACVRIHSATMDEVSRIVEYKKDISVRPKIKTEYNEYLRNKRTSQVYDRHFDYNRQKILSWDLLDDDNKDHEFKVWMKGNYSIINDRNIDFTWLFGRDPNLANDVVKNIFTRHNYTSEAIENMIRTLPKEQYLKILPEIFGKDKSVYINALSNENTPEDFTVVALKALAKLRHMPVIKVKLTNNIINQLAPITRLEVLEKVVSIIPYKSKESPLVDVKTPDDLKQLVFSATIRHYDRVNNLVKTYSDRINWRQNE